MDVEEASDACGSVLDAVGNAVVADRDFFETVLIAVLARGHALLEDVPGTGKTLTARAFAAALGLEFSRVQFTPDLLPGDVTGTNVYNERDDRFEFRKGPVFANVVLADEINRAPPKTQAALLEAMEEEQVTVDGGTHDLPSPFFVIATQNPVESEGSLHPDETVYMNGRLWRAGDALAHAREHGHLMHDGDTRLYALDATTETLSTDGEMIETDCLLYETEYEGEVYTIRTATGRETRVSGNHPFLVDRSGVLQWVAAADLRTDDALVAPSELDSPNDPLPDHEEAIKALADFDEFTVVPRDRVISIRRRLDALAPEESLDASTSDALRIVAGLSKKQLAQRLDASYDSLLAHLTGADNGLSSAVTDACSQLDIPAADCIESFHITRLRASLSDAEAGFFIGAILSAGHHSDTSVRVSRQPSPELFARWVRLAKELGVDPEIRDDHDGRVAVVDSKPLVEYLDYRYALRSPESLLSAPESFREAFLETFLLAESDFDAQRRRITFTRQDRETTNLIAHLLLQFGLTPRMSRSHDGGFELRIQEEALSVYVERFEWPGEYQPVDLIENGHRPVPVSGLQFPTVANRHGGPHGKDTAERPGYNRHNALGSGTPTASSMNLTVPVDDMRAEISLHARVAPLHLTERDLSTAASHGEVATTDTVGEPTLTNHHIRQSFGKGDVPEQTVPSGADTSIQHVHEVASSPWHPEDSIFDDVLYDPISEIDSESYDGTVVGLSVPGTHNYIAGLGACGINHNTFPLPEAQVDRFAVKTTIGYPNEAGELELLRRRAGRAERAPSVAEVLDPDAVAAVREVPETIRVDDDILRYMAGLTRATRRDRRVRVGVSPRGTQRLFEASRAIATLRGRTYVTPDDVKRVAQPVLAHRLVLTADARVEEVKKREVIADVLDEITVPTV